MFFFSSRRRHTRCSRDWSSDVCSSDLIPRHETRLRLSCMWPILSAGESLKLVRWSPDLLNPAVKVKISRTRVYCIMGVTILTGACAYTGTAYYGHLRKYLI